MARAVPEVREEPAAMAVRAVPRARTWRAATQQATGVREVSVEPAVREAPEAAEAER